MDDADSTLSMVLFSGTDDRLGAAAVLAVGAAALGRPVNILLQYWALRAFRTGHLQEDHGVSAEGGAEGAASVRHALANGTPHWSTLLQQAKEIGAVDIEACAQSMEILGIERADLDPLVDGVEGVAAFMSGADGPVVFV